MLTQQQVNDYIMNIQLQFVMPGEVTLQWLRMLLIDNKKA